MITGNGTTLLLYTSTRLQGLLKIMGQIHRVNSELEDQQVAPPT